MTSILDHINIPDALWTCDDTPDDGDLSADSPLEALANEYDYFDEDEVKLFGVERMTLYCYRLIDGSNEQYQHALTITLEPEEVRVLIPQLEAMT